MSTSGWQATARTAAWSVVESCATRQASPGPQSSASFCPATAVDIRKVVILLIDAKLARVAAQRIVQILPLRRRVALSTAALPSVRLFAPPVATAVRTSSAHLSPRRLPPAPRVPLAARDAEEALPLPRPRSPPRAATTPPTSPHRREARPVATAETFSSQESRQHRNKRFLPCL